MKQFFVTVAGVFFGMAVFFGFFLVVVPIVAVAMFASAAQEAERDIPARGDIVLELDLRRQMTDQPSAAPFAFAQAPALLDLVRGLAAAETDDRVKGVFIRANEGGLPVAQAQEIREALQGVREAGKFVVAHSQGFSSTSVIPYLAVSASDEIWLQQTAGFATAGLSSETLFLGGALEQFEAEAQILQIAEYKNAANVYTQDSFTPEHREATAAILNSVFDQSVEMIAQDRGLTPQEVRDLFEAAPYAAEDAARAGLIDRVGHLVEVREAIEERADGARFTTLSEYLEQGQRAWRRGETIALISGQGEIVTGESWDQDNLFATSDIMGSDTVAQAFLDAAEDDDVRAIIFRIDSPGGSIVASEQIWHAVSRAREAGKPIIVSMGPTAASGGYYVSAPADAIVAQPGTLTGSIGIYGGKLVIGDTLGLVGLNAERLTVGGPFAGAYSSQQPFTESQLASLQRTLEEGYDTFTGHVAEGRGLTPARVEEVARGRVWTGAQAFDLNLVDRLGGFREALATAKELAGLEDDADVRLKSYPGRLSPMEQLRRLFGMSAETGEVLAMLSAVASSPEVRAAIAARAATDGQSDARANLPEVR